MRLWLERAPFLELLPNPPHGCHTKAQKLRNFTGALIPFVEMDNSLARLQWYCSHDKTHPATRTPSRSSYIIYGIALSRFGDQVVVGVADHLDPGEFAQRQLAAHIDSAIDIRRVGLTAGHQAGTGEPDGVTVR